LLHNPVLDQHDEGTFSRLLNSGQESKPLQWADLGLDEVPVGVDLVLQPVLVHEAGDPARQHERRDEAQHRGVNEQHPPLVAAQPKVAHQGQQHRGRARHSNDDGSPLAPARRTLACLRFRGDQDSTC
jgi:hypothetical protein